MTEEKQKIKIVIDTDVGTDCDDLFALAYAMQNPNVEIKAITTVHGNTELRAKIARKLERILGKNIPIIPGESCSEEMVKKYWTGIEEKILTEGEKAEILEQYSWPEYDAETRLVCIGPLTNIAMQLEKNPAIKNVRGIYLMGSSSISHNFEVDLAATQKVFDQDWQIFQIMKDDALKIAFSKEELESFRGNKLGNLLYQSSSPWLDYTKRNKASMYDVLVMSAALDESFVKFYSWDNIHTSHDVDLKLKQKLAEAIKNAS